MKIIVTGSLGNIGKPLAIELIKQNHDVTVISSKAEKQKEIEKLGATAAIGSLEEVDFLTTAFSGADAAFCMIPPDFTQSDNVSYYRKISNNYARAIEQSGVKRVVHLSSIGAHLDKGTGFILGSHHAESILDELSEVSVTHLRPGYFYTNLYGFSDMIKEAGIIGANYGGDDIIVMAAPADIAAVAAEELTKLNGNIVRYVTSDEHTADEAAYILGNAIGKPDLKWLTFTNEETQEAMEKKGLPAHIAVNFVEMGDSIHSGMLREHYELHRPSAMEKVKLEDFAKEFAAAF